MQFQPGNQFWMERLKSGRNRRFADPETLWQEAVEYFTWCNENPLQDYGVYGKDAVLCKVPRMRAYTWAGLRVWCNVSTFEQYHKLADFSDVLQRIESVMYMQKFEGAAAGMLKENIIARDLGLKEKNESDIKNQHSGEIKLTLIGDSSIPFASTESEIKE